MKKLKLCTDCNHPCHCIALNKKSSICQYSNCKCNDCSCFTNNIIKDKKLALIAIKENRYQIEKVHKKFLGDKDIIKTALETKDPSKWAIDPLSTFIRLSKIKDRKFIKYLISKSGSYINILDKKFKKDKELALIAVKQDGNAINSLDEKLQIDTDIIKFALKTGSTSIHKGKKRVFHLPEKTYWHLKLKENKKKGIGKVEGLKIFCSWTSDHERYYWGETLNGIPHGHGYAETYETSDIIKKISKKVGKVWNDRYMKKSGKKMEGYILIDKYIGEWNCGIQHGKGEFIEYYEPEYFVNSDGTPKVMNKFIGNFKNGKKEGKFNVYTDTGNDDQTEADWSSDFFKDDYPKKIIKKK